MSRPVAGFTFDVMNVRIAHLRCPSCQRIQWAPRNRACWCECGAPLDVMVDEVTFPSAWACKPEGAKP